MIYWLLYYEFFKIGFFAVGGGLVSLPFLFELSAKYFWFTTVELADMVAVSEATPGPLGINMATYAGIKAAGMWGGVIATMGIVTPSLIVVMSLSNLLKKYKESHYLLSAMSGIRPAVIALIMYAGFEIGKMAIVDVKTLVLFAIFVVGVHFYKKTPIFYIVLSAIVGVVLQL